MEKNWWGTEPSANKWTCGNCIESFGYINGFDAKFYAESLPCPCSQKNVNRDEIFLLLDEYTGHGPLDGGDDEH
jgi:hypothetical protein